MKRSPPRAAHSANFNPCERDVDKRKPNAAKETVDNALKGTADAAEIEQTRGTLSAGIRPTAGGGGGEAGGKTGHSRCRGRCGTQDNVCSRKGDTGTLGCDAGRRGG